MITPAHMPVVTRTFGGLVPKIATATALGCIAALLAMPTASTETTLLTKALIMGGTFQPTPSQTFADMAINDYINPTVNPDVLPGDARVVMYPASGGIIGGPGAPTINESVAIGVDKIDEAIAAYPGERIVVFGYSQSTVVSMIEKTRLEERKARGEAVPDVTFVGIGVGNRPHGGITTRLNGLTIPIFDFSFNGPAPTDPEFGFTTVDISREYDGLADFPLYPANFFSDANAILGVVFVHALYNEVSLDPNSPKYVPGTTSEQFGDTTYYQIPTPDLPLFDPARLLGVPESLIDIVEPAAKVVVDAGYDRTIPFGKPTPLRLMPKVDPVKLTSDLATAVGAGVDNALRVLSPHKNTKKKNPSLRADNSATADDEEPGEESATGKPADESADESPENTGSGAKESTSDNSDAGSDNPGSDNSGSD